MHNTPSYFSHRIFFFVLFALSSLLIPVHAESITLVREYTYNASENDSKVSARKSALQQLQRLVIEEVGTQVQSSFSSSQSIQDEKFEEQVLSNFQSFSQALTKTKIIEEKWNGESFYIKAEIEVDPEGITTTMNAILSGESGIEICELNKEKSNTLWNKPANTERNQALVDLALKRKFDDDCNRWQYRILSNLIYSIKYPIDAYRPFLFKQLKDVKSYELPKLLPKVLYYAKADTGNTTPDEWDIVLNNLDRIPTINLYQFFQALPVLDPSQYTDKVNDLFKLAAQGKLGDQSLSEIETIQHFITLSFKTFPEFSAQLYLENADELVDINTLVPTIRKIYEAGYLNKSTVKVDSELSDSVMSHFLDNNEIESLNRRAQSVLYETLRPLVNNQKETETQNYQFLRDLLKKYPNKFAQLIESRRMNAAYKNLFLLQYNLPAVNVCSPLECVKLVRSKKLETSQKSVILKYLIAYGKEAKVTEKEIIKLFERIQVARNTTDRSLNKTALITILTNIETSDPTAIKLLIKSLKDLDYNVPQSAIDALSKLKQPAFDSIKSNFNDVDTLTKRRMIDAIAEMKDVTGIVEFLESITPTDQKMKFALEDAMEMHQ